MKRPIMTALALLAMVFLASKSQAQIPDIRGTYDLGTMRLTNSLATWSLRIHITSENLQGQITGQVSENNQTWKPFTGTVNAHADVHIVYQYTLFRVTELTGRSGIQVLGPGWIFDVVQGGYARYNLPFFHSPVYDELGYFGVRKPH